MHAWARPTACVSALVSLCDCQLYNGTNFDPDDGSGAISDPALRAKAANAGHEITYTCVPPVPSLSVWGLMLLSGVLASTGLMGGRRGRSVGFMRR